MMDHATSSAGSLARQLDAFAEALLGRAEPRIVSGLRALQAGACAGFSELRPLGVGQTAPDFMLSDQHGAPVSLAEVLSHGPVMLTFFRGGWCPFCTISLRAFAPLAAALRREGASLLAISPQNVAENATTAAASGLAFPILSDPGHEVARRFGLVWQLDGEMRDLYRRLGHDIPALNGTEEWALPIPATFVVARDGRVAFAHVDPRVTKRVEPGDALAAVRALVTDAALPPRP